MLHYKMNGLSQTSCSLLSQGNSEPQDYVEQIQALKVITTFLSLYLMIQSIISSSLLIQKIGEKVCIVMTRL